MKILVIKFRNIGDVLLTTPLISNLKYYYPNSCLHFALNDGTQSMLDDNPNIDKIHIYQRKKRNLWNKILYELAFAIELKKNKFDIIIQTTSGERGIYLALFCGAKTIVSPQSKKWYLNEFITHKFKVDFKSHIIDSNLEALKALGFEVINKKVEIFSDEFQGDLPSKFIHIHPFSRWMFKCIKDETLAEIIDFCEKDLNIKTVITADNNEKELSKLKVILELCSSLPIIKYAGKLDLKNVAALSKKSIMFIGVDTAIMHIAAANDIPSIAFFGPSGAFNWGAWDNSFLHSKYTFQNGIQNMGKHTVIQESFTCVPCGQDGCNGTKISDCLMSLNIEKIKKIIEKKFNIYK